MKSQLLFVKPVCLLFALIWLFVPFHTSVVNSAQINVNEAITVANVWLQLEERLEKERKGMTSIEETSNFMTCFFLAADGSLEENTPSDSEILAYVVVYQPRGFVVVSADDRLEPIMCFSRESTFRPNLPERSFLRTFLTYYIPCYFSQLNKEGSLKSGLHTNWSKLRAVVRGDKGKEFLSSSEGTADVHVHWETPTWDQFDPYNREVEAHLNNVSCDVPAGCTAVAMAELLRFHRRPSRGEGRVQWQDGAGNDVWGDHDVNFDTEDPYDYEDMPMDALSAPNPEVARLIYHCGVAQRTDWTCQGFAFAPPIAAPFNNHFKYRNATEIPFSGGSADKIIESVRSMLPVVCNSVEPWRAHTIMVDGYRSDNGHVHVNCGWDGGSNGWFMLNDDDCCGDTSPYVHAIVYAAPESYVYCDDGCGGTHTGTVKNPFKTFKDGRDDVPSGGVVFLKGGTYKEAPITISTSMTLRSYYGSATISK